MVNCCVIGCKNHSERKLENVTFHTFPKDDTVRRSWLRSTGRRNWEPTKYTRMCSQHFADHCFRRTQHRVYLETSSFPTLFIHNGPIVSHDDSTDGSEPMDYQAQQSHQRCKLNHNHSDSNLGDTYAEKCTPAAVSSGLMQNKQRLNGTEIMHTGDEETLTLSNAKLIMDLKRITFLAESHRKKIAVLKSKNRQLEKKNVELTAVIENLNTKRYLTNEESADLAIPEPK